jgi:hypothetical protein
MNKEKYNGYINRSTWLAKLHIDNTNEDIYKRAIEIAVQANTLKQFKNMIKPILLDIPLLWKEQDFDGTKIDFMELWNAIEKNNK